MASRLLDDLRPEVASMARSMLAACKARGLDVLVTCTKRTSQEQAALYAQGRTSPGKVVTQCKAGESRHECGEAFDVVPLRNGKPVWGTAGDDLALWLLVGMVGESCGLEWAGRWKSFREFPHFQYRRAT